jgi:hypothetical protein
MTRKRLLIGVAALTMIIAVPIAWYLISPLFITRAVNEDFPAVQAAPTAPDKTGAVMGATAEAMPEEADTMATATSDVNREEANTAMKTEPDAMVEETSVASETPTATPEPPTALPPEPVAIKSGQFHAVEHEGSGTATIYQLPDGKYVLRLENFEVLNGPDLYVWLSSASDANDAATILNSTYVSLGRLKGNVGNQNYELPPDLDISAYHSVSIWCQLFSVNFATAPLN